MRSCLKNEHVFAMHWSCLCDALIFLKKMSMTLQMRCTHLCDALMFAHLYDAMHSSLRCTHLCDQQCIQPLSILTESKICKSLYLFPDAHIQGDQT